MSSTGKGASPSIYSTHASGYLERGIPVLPVWPGQKKPGHLYPSGWAGLSNWTRYCRELPVATVIDIWETWPLAGICMPCGPQSGIVALDFDCSGKILKALEKAVGVPSPVRKRGAKGYTGFYRYNGEQSLSWDVNGERVIDVLGDGRQTVLPPSQHPDQISYHWITEDVLPDFPVSELPALPADLASRITQALKPFQQSGDMQARQDREPTHKCQYEDLSEAQKYFRDLKDCALANLDAWVPALLPGARRKSDGSYRAIAHWRGCENPNVGIHPTGIVDWGGNDGMTPIDIAMRVNDWDHHQAIDWLKETLGPLFKRREEPALRVVSINNAPRVDAREAPELPEETIPPPPEDLLYPPGKIGEVARWIDETAPKPQPALAVQAALALASVLGGRIYRTEFNNYTPLYFLNVAKSAAGKEWAKYCIERILDAAGLAHLIGGSGYTSAGAVFSQLLERPCHISLVDEFGKMLQSSHAINNQHKADAITQLIEAFGRCGGTMRPPAYSTMTMNAQNRAAVLQQRIEAPAITLLGMTTPGTFYEALSGRSIQDGFLGRFLVVESHIGRQERNDRPMQDVPGWIVDWAKRVRNNWSSGNLAGTELGADIRPVARTVPFAPAAKQIFKEYERETLMRMDELEADGLDVLLGRAVEIAMRVSLNLALGSDRWDSLTAEEEHARWGVRYQRYHGGMLVKSARSRISDNEDERVMKRMIEYITSPRRYANDARYRAVCFAGFMPKAKLCKLMKMKSRDFKHYVETLVAMDMVEEIMPEGTGVRCLRLLEKHTDGRIALL